MCNDPNCSTCKNTGIGWPDAEELARAWHEATELRIYNKLGIPWEDIPPEIKLIEIDVAQYVLDNWDW